MANSGEKRPASTVDQEMAILIDILLSEEVQFFDNVFSPSDYMIHVPVSKGCPPIKYLEKFGFLLEQVVVGEQGAYFTFEVDHNSIQVEALHDKEEWGLKKEKVWASRILNIIGENEGDRMVEVPR